MLATWKILKFCSIVKSINFTKHQNFRLVKIENICRGQNKSEEKLQNVLGKVENNVGRGENLGYQQMQVLTKGRYVFFFPMTRLVKSQGWKCLYQPRMFFSV